MLAFDDQNNPFVNISWVMFETRCAKPDPPNIINNKWLGSHKRKWSKFSFFKSLKNRSTVRDKCFLALILEGVTLTSYSSGKNASNWTPKVSFELLRSWIFQNCPWLYNLMHFWLSYQRLKLPPLKSMLENICPLLYCSSCVTMLRFLWE